MTEQTVRVLVRGQEFVLKSGVDANYVKHLADFVDKKLEALQKASPPGTNIGRLAVLTSINIADELHQKTKVPTELLSKLSEQITRINQKLDMVLQSSQTL